MRSNHEALMYSALEEIHFYVDASDQQLIDDGVTRNEVLNSARYLWTQVQANEQEFRRQYGLPPTPTATGGPMHFPTAYTWMKHGKKMRVPGFLGYWMWDKEKQTIVIVTKNNQHMDIRDTPDVDFTLGFVNSGEWEFYNGADDPRQNDIPA